MSGTNPIVRSRTLLVSAWVLLLTFVGDAWAVALQATGTQNVPGDAYLWQLAQRAGEATNPAWFPGDTHLYEQVRRVQASAASGGFDWMWVYVAIAAAVVVVAAVMLVVTARRHHWHPHLPVRHGHA